MKRRDFLKMATKGSLGAATLGLAACSGSAAELTEEAAQNSSLPEVNWEMATSWPISLDTIFGGAQTVAERVSAMTQGRFNISARAAGELVPGLEVLDAVSDGSVQIGHTASYYYVGKSPTVAFGTALPFGLTARQQNAWLYEGGGLDLMQEFYRDRFNVIQFPAGNTGVQMGGWFNTEINSPSDLEGLKIRIPGLGGQVMDRLGATVQVIPGGEIFQALQTGAIDAAEWVGPYDDEKLGFAQVSSYYYYPGWWEPGPTLEIQVNLDEWNQLPEEYQEILKTASYEANLTMMARYDALNPDALIRLTEEEDIELRPFPDDVLRVSEEASFSLYDEFSQQDTDFNSIFGEWKAFRDKIQRWHQLGEAAMLTYETNV